MRLVAIESPLRAATPEDHERNRLYALWCAHDCFVRGEAAYASHLFFTQFLDDTDPRQREFGVAAGLAWAAKADLRAFYVDLGWGLRKDDEPTGMERAWESFFRSDDYIPGPGYLSVFHRKTGQLVAEARTLPPQSIGAYIRGEYPRHTPGFGK